MRDNETIVQIFTDGACQGNPGPGGWGVVTLWQGESKEFFGGENKTTNNRMELTAAIQALETLSTIVSTVDSVILSTDSRYVQQGVTQWMPKWKLNNWRTASKQPVKNRDLWEALDSVLALYEISWRWVKAHNGHLYNERADALAKKGIPAV